MKVETLKKLIENGESQTLEFKKSLSDVNKIIEEVCGFANTSGGTIVIGVTNSGEVFNVKVGKDTLEKLTNKITNNTDPIIYPIIEVIEIENKKVIVIEIEESKNKPHFAAGKAFKRVGKSTIQMSRDEYERLVLEKHKDKLQFDVEICKNATFDDLDEEKVFSYLEKRAKKRGIEIPEIPLKKILVNIGAAVKKNKKLSPTNAGILFFGKDPQRFIPHSELKIARFMGTDMVEFIDRAELHATLPELIDESEKFVKRNTRRATKIVEFEQFNVTEYPYEAIREAITNAVVHRDYFFSGASIRVMIFEDRIEVESPGKLPEGVTLKTLEGSHVLRNEKIANLLYDIGYIEKWGTGIRRMKDAMKMHGLKEPVFEERGKFFKVTFYGPGDNILDLIPPKNRTNLKKLGLNERQISAFKLMVNESKVFTSKEYSELFKISRKTAQRDLLDLVKRGLIKQEGVRRGTKFIYKRNNIPKEY